MKKGGSLSLFISLFDLGAIVDYQLKTDSAVNNTGSNTPVIKKNYQINLGQIVSPGGYIVYGFFSNLPLAVGIGAEYGPGLSKISSNGTATLNNPSWRYNLFLTVDIPFFNIMNIKRKN
jgi:hypothetical protein